MAERVRRAKAKRFRICPRISKKGLEISWGKKHGKIKPVPDFCLSEVERKNFESKPGGYILFHDSLIHGGVVSNNKTRISLEFTAVVCEKAYYKNVNKDLYGIN